MEFERMISQLRRNAMCIEQGCAGVTEQEAKWRPAPEKWSILEVINHLVDEETLDFRTRVDYTLHKTGEAWPRIDPQGWVKAHGYNERNFAESLKNFMAARNDSLAWLATLQHPDFDRSYVHPQIGVLRAGDVFTSWIAHDLRHIRQITTVRIELVRTAAAPYSIAYAG